ncbi:MAG: zinc-ribbon domain containing protein [Bacteroidota bacterium]
MKKASTYRCPCCRAQVPVRDMQQVLSLLPFDGIFFRQGDSLQDSFLMMLKRYPGLYPWWACDDCIRSKKALLGNPKRQFYIFGHPMDTAPPFLAYWDRRYTCHTCQGDFTFGMHEQQFWYEQKAFVVHSQPKNCLDCRIELRERKALNTELSTLLADGTPTNKAELKRIAEIYELMGKSEKRKAYEAALRKLRN